MKSLNRVQTMVKVFKILATIAFVCCIISTVGCALGAIIVNAVGENAEFIKMLEQEGVAYDRNIYVCACVCAAVESVLGIYIAYLNKTMFKKELEKGTPFDKDIVALVRKNAVIQIVASIVAAIAVAIIIACFNAKLDISNGAAVGTGIFYLLLSLLLDYGADLAAEKKETEKIIDDGDPFGVGD